MLFCSVATVPECPDSPGFTALVSCHALTMLFTLTVPERPDSPGFTALVSCHALKMLFTLNVPESPTSYQNFSGTGTVSSYTV